MPEMQLIRHCAPTLAGIKTGNLVSVQYSDMDELENDLAEINRLFAEKGVKAVLLSYKDCRALIYLYRPAYLERDMRREETAKILMPCGYDCANAQACVDRLRKRIAQTEDFPHEIGLFLSYPPEDVRGFIDHRDTGCKMVGYWRVYSDEEYAKKTFDRYRKCTKIYKDLWQKGRTLNQLTARTFA